MEWAIDRNNSMHYDEEGKYLIFYLGDQKYGISVDNIIDIVENRKGMIIKDLSKNFVYSINFEESIIPVMDLRLRFGKKIIDNFTGNFIIIIKIHNICIGIIVDKLLGVKNIEEKSMNSLSEYRDDFIGKIVKGSEKKECILNIDKLIDENEYKIIINLEGYNMLAYI